MQNARLLEVDRPTNFAPHRTVFSKEPHLGQLGYPMFTKHWRCSELGRQCPWGISCLYPLPFVIPTFAIYNLY